MFVNPQHKLVFGPVLLFNNFWFSAGHCNVIFCFNFQANASNTCRIFKFRRCLQNKFCRIGIDQKIVLD